MAAAAATMLSPMKLRALRRSRPRYGTLAWSRSGRFHPIDEAGVDEGGEIRQALDLFQRQHVVRVDFRLFDFLRPKSPRQFDIGYRGFDSFLLVPELAGRHRDHGVLVGRSEISRPLVNAHHHADKVRLFGDYVAMGAEHDVEGSHRGRIRMFNQRTDAAG